MEDTLGSTPKLRTALSNNSRLQNISTLDESNFCKINWSKALLTYVKKARLFVPGRTTALLKAAHFRKFFQFKYLAQNCVACVAPVPS